jgi:hypothetical protein
MIPCSCPAVVTLAYNMQGQAGKLTVKTGGRNTGDKK